MATRRGGLSKKAKVEQFDALKQERDLMHLLLYDIARGVEPDAIVERSEPDIYGRAEDVHAEGKMWRAIGASGGIVLLRTWTRYRDSGDPDSVNDVQVVRLDDIDGRLVDERSKTFTAGGRAMCAVARELKQVREYAYKMIHCR